MLVSPQPITVKPKMATLEPIYYYGVLITDEKIGLAPHFDDVMQPTLEKAVRSAMNLYGMTGVTVLSIIKTDIKTGLTSMVYDGADIDEMYAKHVNDELDCSDPNAEHISDYYSNII